MTSVPALESTVPHPSLPSPWSPDVDPWLPALRPWTQDPAPPVIWSVAATDSGGGAGLAADTRAAAAMGVHLCTVVAAVTAQHSLGVQGVFPVATATLRAQLHALRSDLPARVVKTGLLASASAVDVLLAQRGDAQLVVDPVLGATAGGASFCNDELLAAYRHQLLPQAALITPNRREAERLLGVAPGQWPVPELARRLRRLGAQAVCITGGDDGACGALPDGDALQDGDALPGGAALALDWLDSPLATGWIALPRLQAAPGQRLHHHGSGCTFATAAAAALARGFPLPDAVILAKMLTWAALRGGHAAGAGAGPLRPGAAFVSDAAAMPVMSQPDEEVLSPALLQAWAQALRGSHRHAFTCGPYAITDQPGLVSTFVQSGVFRHVQLRIKRGETQDGATAHDEESLRNSIRQALASVADPACTVWINDHWQLALECGATALHLGQEDWAALTPAQRQDLQHRCQQGGLRLGLSSHSLWELCRARAVGPTYIACGPLWPTTTKDMPWQPQGLAQLGWWARMAGRPVVAIGGILDDGQVEAAWRAGASAVCLVRAAQGWLSRQGHGAGALSPSQGAPAPKLSCASTNQ